MSARFLVRAADAPRAHAHPAPEATDPLEAALLHVERWAAPAGEISVVVVDCETGVEQCFRIDLAGHAAEPC